MSDDTVQRVLLVDEAQNYGTILVDHLKNMLFDWNWELRETATVFVSSFFKVQVYDAPYL